MGRVLVYGGYATMADGQEATKPRRRPDVSETVRVGRPVHPLTDAYFHMMAGPWHRLIGFIIGVFLLANLIFALLYLGGGDCVEGARPGRLDDYFFFSVQTFATIGYGGMAPSTDYAEVIMTGEAVAGILMTALATGLVFAKFARPHARVLFSENVLMTTFDGQPALMFRVGNARGNDVVEAAMRVSVLKPIVTSDGHTMRRLLDLELMRDNSPVFALSWLVIHIIDPESPLYGETHQSICEKRMRFIVTMTGLDGTFSQQVHARHIYESPDLLWNHTFVDVISDLPDGRLKFDYGKFHDTKPMPHKVYSSPEEEHDNPGGAIIADPEGRQAS